MRPYEISDRFYFNHHVTALERFNDDRRIYSTFNYVSYRRPPNPCEPKEKVKEKRKITLAIARQARAHTGLIFPLR